MAMQGAAENSIDTIQAKIKALQNFQSFDFTDNTHLKALSLAIDFINSETNNLDTRRTLADQTSACIERIQMAINKATVIDEEVYTEWTSLTAQYLTARSKLNLALNEVKAEAGVPREAHKADTATPPTVTNTPTPVSALLSSAPGTNGEPSQTGSPSQGISTDQVDAPAYIEISPVAADTPSLANAQPSPVPVAHLQTASPSAFDQLIERITTNQDQAVRVQLAYAETPLATASTDITAVEKLRQSARSGDASFNQKKYSTRLEKQIAITLQLADAQTDGTAKARHLQAAYQQLQLLQQLPTDRATPSDSYKSLNSQWRTAVTTLLAQPELTSTATNPLQQLLTPPKNQPQVPLLEALHNQQKAWWKPGSGSEAAKAQAAETLRQLQALTISEWTPAQQLRFIDLLQVQAHLTIETTDKITLLGESQAKLTALREVLLANQKELATQKNQLPSWKTELQKREAERLALEQAASQEKSALSSENLTRPLERQIPLTHQNALATHNLQIKQLQEKIAAVQKESDELQQNWRQLVAAWGTLRANADQLFHQNGLDDSSRTTSQRIRDAADKVLHTAPPATDIPPSTSNIPINTTARITLPTAPIKIQSARPLAPNVPTQLDVNNAADAQQTAISEQSKLSRELEQKQQERRDAIESTISDSETAQENERFRSPINALTESSRQQTTHLEWLTTVHLTVSIAFAESKPIATPHAAIKLAAQCQAMADRWDTLKEASALKTAQDEALFMAHNHHKAAAYYDQANQVSSAAYAALTAAEYYLKAGHTDRAQSLLEALDKLESPADNNSWMSSPTFIMRRAIANRELGGRDMVAQAKTISMLNPALLSSDHQIEWARSHLDLAAYTLASLPTESAQRKAKQQEALANVNAASTTLTALADSLPVRLLQLERDLLLVQVGDKTPGAAEAETRITATVTAAPGSAPAPLLTVEWQKTQDNTDKLRILEVELKLARAAKSQKERFHSRTDAAMMPGQAPTVHTEGLLHTIEQQLVELHKLYEQGELNAIEEHQYADSWATLTAQYEDLLATAPTGAADPKVRLEQEQHCAVLRDKISQGHHHIRAIVEHWNDPKHNKETYEIKIAVQRALKETDLAKRCAGLRGLIARVTRSGDRRTYAKTLNDYCDTLRELMKGDAETLRNATGGLSVEGAQHVIELYSKLALEAVTEHTVPEAPSMMQKFRQKIGLDRPVVGLKPSLEEKLSGEDHVQAVRARCAMAQSSLSSVNQQYKEKYDEECKKGVAALALPAGTRLTEEQKRGIHQKAHNKALNGEEVSVGNREAINAYKRAINQLEAALNDPSLSIETKVAILKQVAGQYGVVLTECAPLATTGPWKEHLNKAAEKLLTQAAVLQPHVQLPKELQAVLREIQKTAGHLSHDAYMAHIKGRAPAQAGAQAAADQKPTATA